MTWLKKKHESPKDISVNINEPNSKFLLWLAARMATPTTRMKLYRRIQAPISSGVNVRTAVEQLYQRAAFKGETEVSAIMLRYLLYSLSHGKPFSDGLEPFIPLNEQLLIRSGESEGDLAGSLVRASDIIKKTIKINNAISSAVAKPGMLMSMLLVMMYIVGSFVLPKIDAVFPMDKWVDGAYALAKVSIWVNSRYFLFSILAIALTIAILNISRKRWTGFGRKTADKFPPYNFYRIQQGASWLSTLSAMLQSGRSIKNCLRELHEISEGKNNKYLANRTLKIIRQNEFGAENLGYAMEEAGDNFPDEEVIADLVMRASLSDFDAQITNIADDWIENSIATVERASSVLFMLALLALGSFIGMFVLGVISLNTQIGSEMQGF
jgi:type II secretory pathway component PulF